MRSEILELFKELLTLFRIRAGDIYNRRLFEAGIAELNKLDLLVAIDKDRDTDFTVDQELPLIDIVIKLNALHSRLESRWSSLNREQP